MYKEIMTHNTVVDLPLLALILFACVFAAVIARVWLKGSADPEHRYLERLPLLEDDGDQPAPGAHIVIATPTPTPGADDGR